RERMEVREEDDPGHRVDVAVVDPSVRNIGIIRAGAALLIEAESLDVRDSAGVRLGIVGLSRLDLADRQVQGRQGNVASQQIVVVAKLVAERGVPWLRRVDEAGQIFIKFVEWRLE